MFWFLLGLANVCFLLAGKAFSNDNGTFGVLNIVAGVLCASAAFLPTG